MAAEEITFHVASAGLLGSFTRARPHLAVAVWCDWSREVLEVLGGTDAEADDLRALLAPRSQRVELHAVDATLRLLLMNCVDLHHDLVQKAIADAGALNLPPVRFEAGRARFRVLSFAPARARAMLRALEEAGLHAEVAGKVPLRPQALLNAKGVGVNAVLDGLTDRQLEVLLQAFRHGLYESPRRVAPAAAAKAMGLSRTTFEEHLRKAEARLVAAVAPSLALHLRMRQLGPAPQDPLPPPEATRRRAPA